jgi:hypothetical protein
MKKGLVAIVVSSALLTLGCATDMVPVSDTNDSPIRVSIVIGDTVRVLTKYGDRVTFRVTEITEEVLAGGNESVRYDDMAFVEKRTNRKLNNQESIAVGATLLIAAGAVMYLGGNGVDVSDLL